MNTQFYKSTLKILLHKLKETKHKSLCFTLKRSADYF